MTIERTRKAHPVKAWKYVASEALPQWVRDAKLDEADLEGWPEGTWIVQRELYDGALHTMFMSDEAFHYEYE